MIDQEKRDELIEEDPRQRGTHQTVATGRGHQTVEGGLRLVFTSFLHTPWSIDIEQYPAIEEHMKWFRGELGEGGLQRVCIPWFELQQPRKA